MRGLMGHSWLAFTLASALNLAVPAFANSNPAVSAARAAAEKIDVSAKPAEAETAWRNVIRLERTGGKPDTALIALAMNRIGDTQYYAGHPELAQKTLEEAQSMLIAASMSESDIMSETLANLGTMHTAQGRPEIDAGIQRRGLDIRIKLYGPDDPRLAINYYNLGYALSEAGSPAESARNLERGTRMRLATMKPDNPELFFTLASAAAMLTNAGKLDTAVEFAQDAVDLVLRYHPGHPYTGYTRGVLGKALVKAGRAREAAQVLRLSMDELAATMGKTNRLTMDATENLAVSLGRMGQYAEAEELTMQTIGPNIEGMAPDVVRAYLSASNYAAEAGSEARAIDIAERGYAFALEKLGPEHAVRGQMAAALASHLERRGDDTRALALFQESAKLLAKQEYDNSTALMDAEIQLGGSEIRNNMRDQGYARVVAAADKLAPRVFDAADNPELGQSNSFYDSFARAAEAAADMSQPADAFRFYQLASYDVNVRASEQVALRNAAGRSGQAAQQVRSLQDAQRSLRALNVQKAGLLAASKIEQAAVVDKDIGATRELIRTERAALQTQIPGFERLSRPGLLSLEQVQSRLGKGEALFVALPSRERTTILLIRSDRADIATSRLPRSAIRSMVQSIRASIDGALMANDGAVPPFDTAAAYQLYQVLFPGGIRRAATGIDILHVAASDALAELPFSLLLTKPQKSPSDDLRRANWLIRDMSIDVPVTLASIGAPVDSNRGATGFAGIGAPLLNGQADKPVQLASLYRDGRVEHGELRELPPLPAAQTELEQMRTALGSGNALLLTGAKAREATVRKMDLSSYSVLAFATHGLIADEIDGLAEPALVLTPPATNSPDDDGLLTASEIAALNLNADFVILSACNTAAGSTQSAPAYTGLAHAFLYAGARSLLLSHWQVRDDAAERLSVATVRGTAEGQDRAAALREAMLDLMKDRNIPDSAHPAIWAPFILIGQ